MALSSCAHAQVTVGVMCDTLVVECVRVHEHGSDTGKLQSNCGQLGGSS